MDDIILVDANDNPTGTMEKMEAHRKGILHRAFSVLVFNSRGEMLLQKRSSKKYHSAGLWTNTCCSHPKPNEALNEAAHLRLIYEMGIDVQPEFAFKFIYRAALDQNLIEHELDHVLLATFDGIPMINEEEVDDWKYMSLSSIRDDMQQNPQDYTAWFRIIVDHPKLRSVPV